MSTSTIAVCGDAAAAGISAKLDLFHDCLQYGTGTVNPVRSSQTWWAILGRILTDWVEAQVTMTQAADRGNTAARSAEGLGGEVFPHAPDQVLVMLGSEDALIGTDARAFREALERIVDQCTSGSRDTPGRSWATSGRCTRTRPRR